tara:strand:- start:5437 stop:5640 length:204 start_codon:yes stop_codon:yes gene_type:complete
LNRQCVNNGEAKEGYAKVEVAEEAAEREQKGSVERGTHHAQRCEERDDDDALGVPAPIDAGRGPSRR